MGLLVGSLIVGGLASIGYGIFKQVVPSEAPKVDPIYGSGTLRLNFDKSMAIVGKPVPVVVEWGPVNDSEGGFDLAVLDQLSPDGKRAALRWTSTSFKELVPGRLYWADSNYPPTSFPDELRQRAASGQKNFR